MNKASSPRVTKFFVCDDVRREAAGKLTIVGWYSGERVVLHPTEGLKGWRPAVAICYLLQVEGASGSYLGRLALATPSGKEVASSDLGAVVLDAMKPRLIYFRGGPVPIPEFGIYSLTLQLGKDIQVLPIEFARGEGVIEGGTVIPAPPPARKRAKKSTASKKK